MKTLFKKIGWLTALLLIATFTLAPGIRYNSDARLNSLDMATDSTVTSQNKFLSFKFGSQNWGQPAGRLLTIYADKTLTCADSGKIIVFGEGADGTAETVTLPEAEPDCQFTFIWNNAKTNVIDPTATDIVKCDSSATSAGATVTATDIGDMITIVGVDVNTWMCTNVSLVTGFTFN
jgi:hypothetical protein